MPIKIFLRALCIFNFALTSTVIRSEVNETLEHIADGLHINSTLIFSVALVKHIYEKYKLYTNSFKQHESNLTQYTDQQFKQWALGIIDLHDNNSAMPLICVTSPNISARPCAHSFAVPQSVDTSGEKHCIFLPFEYQKHMLQHLSKEHTCTNQCMQKINEVIAVIDHEYAHIKHNDSLAITPLLLPAITIHSIASALSYLYIKPHSLFSYIYSSLWCSLIPLISVSLCLNKQESRADENIRNDLEVLTANKAALEKLNNKMKTKPSINSLPFPMGLVHANGNCFLFSLDQRIKRLQERINELKNTQNSSSKAYTA